MNFGSDRSEEEKEKTDGEKKTCGRSAVGFRVESFKDFVCLARGWKSEVMHVI